MQVKITRLIHLISLFYAGSSQIFPTNGSQFKATSASRKTKTFRHLDTVSVFRYFVLRGYIPPPDN